MTIEKLVTKYIQLSSHALESLEIVNEPQSLNPYSIRNILKYAGDYLSDAIYYKDRKKYDVSLTSVAYCEGMLDALRLLGVVKFEWQTEQKRRMDK